MPRVHGCGRRCREVWGKDVSYVDMGQAVLVGRRFRVGRSGFKFA